MEEKKVIYRFDIDFKGTASTAPVINLISTDTDSRMFVMTPKSGGVSLTFDDDTNALMIISYTSGGAKNVIATVSCEYVNGKFVAEIPVFMKTNVSAYEGTVILYQSNGGEGSALSYKLESAPFKIQTVETGTTPGTVTSADEFKALVDAAATAEFYNRVWEDSNGTPDALTVAIASKSTVSNKVIWINPKSGKTEASGNGELTLYFADGGFVKVKTVNPDGSFADDVSLRRIRNGQLVCLWLISSETAIWINAFDNDVFIRTSSDSFDENNKLKTSKGLSVANNGTVKTLDDALIPYSGTMSNNVITFTPPRGYNASGIFSIKLARGTNTAGTVKVKASGGSAEFTLAAYVGDKTVTSFAAGVINANIPMIFVIKNRALVWLNYDSAHLPVATTLPSVLEVGKHYKISATAAITLKLPDTANDGDKIEVEYYNAGTAGLTAQWCTKSSTTSNLPIISNNMGSGGNTSCAAGAMHKGTAVWSGTANKWTLDLEIFNVKSK